MSRPHYHDGSPVTRTVIKGTWYTGEGNYLRSRTRRSALTAGSFMKHPMNTRHFDGSKAEEVIVQLMGTGPSTTTKVDPSKGLFSPSKSPVWLALSLSLTSCGRDNPRAPRNAADLTIHAASDEAVPGWNVMKFWDTGGAEIWIEPTAALTLDDIQSAKQTRDELGRTASRFASPPPAPRENAQVFLWSASERRLQSSSKGK